MPLLPRRRNAPEVPESDPTQPIARIAARSRVRIRGQVVKMRQRPASGLPSLVVTLSDGSASAVAVWSGRRAIGGIGLGRTLIIEGVAVESEHGLVFHNPVYVLLP